ncbi:MAG: hypothetical protein VB078_00265 [Clostridiaceae bacterium]|nr:hypothetical protein [Clostridiaceae bacterium]
MEKVVMIPIKKYDEMTKAVATLEIVRQMLSKEDYFFRIEAVKLVLDIPVKEGK